MKKYLWIIFLILLSIISVIVYFYNLNSKHNSNYSAEKNDLDNSSKVSSNYNTNNISTEIPKTPIEIELSVYSTVIENQKDSNRQGNISITCSVLNNSIVKARRNFFFL